MTFRNMCFTLNNWTQEDVLKIDKWPYKYLVYGQEVGPKCGTPHLQGYVEFKNSMKFSTIQNTFNKRMSVRHRNGTPEEASVYCKKDGNFFEDGKISEQGKRTDVENIIEAVRDGNTNRQLMEDERLAPTYFRYYRHVDNMRNVLNSVAPRTEQPWVEWIHGPTGTGKTHSVFSRHGHENVFLIKSKWWDGYKGQEAILIDDFDPNIWQLPELLRLLDKNPFKGEIKGGWVEINSPFIYITCPCSPNKVMNDCNRGGSIAQLLRRIDETIELTTPYESGEKPRSRPMTNLEKLEAEAEVA